MYNVKLEHLIEACGIEIYVHDYKRHKNICKYCNKKCNNCYLPVIFDKYFSDFFEKKYNETKFEVKLRDMAHI